ncbi:MAG: CDP-diacylglycerol--serine O-phosphatidyltransferase [Gemmatimonadales bacterium]
MTAPRPRPRGMRRAIVILPSAFTSGNLFFGVWSIVESARGNFGLAAWFVIAAAVLDMLDGRVARMSRTGGAFGAELDSLADVVSFGVAPAMLVYFWRFRGGEWAWLLSFIYVLAAALRLARFNVVQAGQAKTHFIGLSSPISGITLASVYPFTQTVFFQEQFGFLPLSLMVALLAIVLALLMVSQVPYPVLPTAGLRTWKGRASLAAHLLALAGAIWFPEFFFFLAGIALIAYGLVRAVALGLLERLPERDLLRDDDEEGERPIDYDVGPGRVRFGLRRRRHSGGQRPGSP